MAVIKFSTMQSYNTSQSDRIETGFIDWLTDNSALILIVGAVTSFIITALIEFFYYQDIFGGSLREELAITLSVLLAIFFQGVRCASLASSAKMFKEGKKAQGFFILLISLSVTVFCAYEAGQIATVWEAGKPEFQGHIKLPVLALVWSGWLLELVLVVSVAATAAARQQRQRQEAQPQNGQQRQRQEVGNGDRGSYLTT